jgi:hypothetical protein
MHKYFNDAISKMYHSFWQRYVAPVVTPGRRLKRNTVYLRPKKQDQRNQHRATHRVINEGAGLGSKERLSGSDGYGSSSEPAADKHSGRAFEAFRGRTPISSAQILEDIVPKDCKPIV